MDQGIEFGEQEDVANCMMRIATDKTLNGTTSISFRSPVYYIILTQAGQSLQITPRSVAKEGFMDLDRDDYKSTPEDEYLGAVQARQLVVIKINGSIRKQGKD